MFKKLWNIVVTACKVIRGAFSKRPLMNFTNGMTPNEARDQVLVTKETKFSWRTWFEGKYRIAPTHQVVGHLTRQTYRNNVNAGMMTILAGLSLLLLISGNPVLATRMAVLTVAQYVGNELNNARLARHAFFY